MKFTRMVPPRPLNAALTGSTSETEKQRERHKERQRERERH